MFAANPNNKSIGFRLDSIGTPTGFRSIGMSDVSIGFDRITIINIAEQIGLFTGRCGAGLHWWHIGFDAIPAGS